MRGHFTAALAALALGAGGACASFEDPAIVIDLRVLSIVADPPEHVLDFDIENPETIVIPRMTVSALVADPGIDRALEWRMTVCPPTDSKRCDDDKVVPGSRQEVAAGTIEDPEGRPGGTSPTVDLTASVQIPLLTARESFNASDVAAIGGIAVQLELRIVPSGGDESQAIYAAKRLVLAPRLPDYRVANSNPSISELTSRRGDFDTTVPPSRCADGVAAFVVASGETVRFDPVEPEGAREDYVLPTLDGGVRMITENLRYSWFATRGSFIGAETGGPIDPFGNMPTLYTEWRAPAEPGLVQLWVVQRDERGGQSWLERCLDVR